MRAIKVAITTLTRGVVGGREGYLEAIVPALVETGVRVGFWHERSLPTATPAAEWDGSVSVWCRERLGEEAALACLRDWAPDVIYHHGLRSATVEARLLQVAPVVAFLHDYYGMCISGSKTHRRPKAMPCQRRFGTPCLAEYFPRRCGGLNPLTMVRQYRYERRRQAQLADFEAVVVASRHMREEYVRHGVSPERLHVVPYFPPGQQPDLNAPKPRDLGGHVLMVGRLTDLKGGELLIEAMSRARSSLDRPLTLTVAGDGPRRGAMEALARRTGIPARFYGWVPTSERIRLMREADVLAVPSVWPEPFGLVGIEGGCVGLPAVGFAVGGIPEWLIPGVSGELAPGDRPCPEEFADALVRALADETHWNRLRTGARETAHRFTLEAHLQRLIPILEQATRGSLAHR